MNIPFCQSGKTVVLQVLDRYGQTETGSPDAHESYLAVYRSQDVTLPKSDG